jgi:hypothetical protein
MHSESGEAPVKIDPGVDLAARILAGDRVAEEEFCSVYRRGVLLVAIARTMRSKCSKTLAEMNLEPQT